MGFVLDATQFSILRIAKQGETPKITKVSAIKSTYRMKCCTWNAPNLLILIELVSAKHAPNFLAILVSIRWSSGCLQEQHAVFLLWSAPQRQKYQCLPGLKYLHRPRYKNLKSFRQNLGILHQGYKDKLNLRVTKSSFTLQFLKQSKYTERLLARVGLIRHFSLLVYLWCPGHSSRYFAISRKRTHFQATLTSSRNTLSMRCDRLEMSNFNFMLYTDCLSVLELSRESQLCHLRTRVETVQSLGRIEQEMKRMKINILGLCETCWT